MKLPYLFPHRQGGTGVEPEPEDANEQFVALSDAREEQITRLRETEKQLTRLIRDLRLRIRPSPTYLLMLILAIIAFIIWVILNVILVLAPPGLFTIEALVVLSLATWISMLLTIGLILFAMALKWR